VVRPGRDEDSRPPPMRTSIDGKLTAVLPQDVYPQCGYDCFYFLESLSTPGPSLSTIERGREPSGHSGWLSAQVIDGTELPDGPRLEESAFCECSQLRTMPGWR